MPQLAIEGARIDRVAQDTFLVVPLGWQLGYLVRIDVRSDRDETDFRARATFSPLALLAIVLWLTWALSSWSEAGPSIIGVGTGLAISLPIQLYRARARDGARTARDGANRRSAA